jgi:hypothetical protein
MMTMRMTNSGSIQRDTAVTKGQAASLMRMEIMADAATLFR